VKPVPPLSESRKSELELISADARTSVIEHMSYWGRSFGTSSASRLG
jgi:hypothetical protein